jgi:hypothetical protein
MKLSGIFQIISPSVPAVAVYPDSTSCRLAPLITGAVHVPDAQPKILKCQLILGSSSFFTVRK